MLSLPIAGPAVPHSPPCGGVDIETFFVAVLYAYTAFGTPPHPWMEFAGMFKDDPYFDDVVEIMAENRRKMDEDPDVP